MRYPNKESYACQVENFAKFGRILQSIAKTKNFTRKMRDSFFCEERYIDILKIHR